MNGGARCLPYQSDPGQSSAPWGRRKRLDAEPDPPSLASLPPTLTGRGCLGFPEAFFNALPGDAKDRVGSLLCDLLVRILQA